MEIPNIEITSKYLTILLAGSFRKGMQVDLGKYKEGEKNLKRAAEILESHSDEVATDSWLLYYKMLLLEYTGRCMIGLNKMDSAVESFNEGIHLAKKHRPHEIRMQTDPLYHKSWALFISGDVDGALNCIKENVDIRTANNIRLPTWVTDAKDYYKSKIEEEVTPQWKAAQLQIYRLQWILTDEGFPSLSDAIKMCDV